MQTKLPPEQISKSVCKHLFFSQYIIMLGHKKNFASQKKADAHQVMVDEGEVRVSDNDQQPIQKWSMRGDNNESLQTLLTEVFTKKRPRGVAFSDGTNSQFGFDEEFNSN